MDFIQPHNDANAQPLPISVNSFNGVSLKTIILDCIGVRELFSKEVWGATITEFVATACFLFTLSTAIISCLESHESDPKLLIPLAVFVIAFLLLVVTVPLSGGHMNPIFTFIAALKGVITFVRAALYFCAQCLGSIMAYLTMKNVMNSSTVEKYSLGGCLVNANGSGISAGTAVLIEFSCTFVVLYVAVTVAFDKGRSKELGLTMVCVMVAGVYGMVVFVSITVTGQAGYGGVGLNPARCLAPALLLGGSLWDGHWVFWVGPLSACILYYVFTLTLPREGCPRVNQERDILIIWKLIWASCWRTGGTQLSPEKIQV